MWINNQKDEQIISLAAAFILTAVGTAYMSPIIYQNRSLRIGITKKFFRHIAYTNLIISILSTSISSIINSHLVNHQLCSSCPLLSDLLLTLAIVCIFIRMTVEQYGDLMKTIQRNQLPFLLRRRILYPFVILICSICISFYGDDHLPSNIDEISPIRDDHNATSSCATIWTIFLAHNNSTKSQGKNRLLTFMPNSISDDIYQRVEQLSKPLWRTSITYFITAILIYIGYSWILSTVWIKARRHSLASASGKMRKRANSSQKSSKWQLFYLIDTFGNQLNKLYINVTDECSAHFYLPIMLKSSLIWIPLRLWYIVVFAKQSPYFLPGDMPAVVSWVCLSMTICSPFGYCFSGDRKHFKNRLWDVMGLIREEKKLKFSDGNKHLKDHNCNFDPLTTSKDSSNLSNHDQQPQKRRSNSLDSSSSTPISEIDGKTKRKSVRFSACIETIDYVKMENKDSEDDEDYVFEYL
ncbi:hypothetical protein TrispH2_009698 [Trichoplax sp. H2]|uniref:Uncharacterized protein n=1 Tax=Trichoplax adhaerens TaxID=10228 RepID=B3RRF5_TRIAD|nr:predicted protein [Trichoplax adhaerens]EDV26867.1 predicted protein [Trichoplax adhaerens]RDD37642.1 hypothetical protein TrispH2_009698 [Trichoplax sp. H2]|eukprot:XP_002110863.1 predicted protein [Trichoplax adhaerens]